MNPRKQISLLSTNFGKFWRENVKVSFGTDTCVQQAWGVLLPEFSYSFNQF